MASTAITTTLIISCVCIHASLSLRTQAEDRLSFISNVTGKDFRSNVKIWMPQNLQRGTPFFIHMPGADPSVVLEKAKEALPTKSKAEYPTLFRRNKDTPRIIFAFAANHDNSPMQWAYENMQAPYQQVARNYKRWNMWGKIGPLIDRLRSDDMVFFDPKDDYVVFTDADDVYPTTSNFTGLIEAFESYDADVVMSATKSDLPPMPTVAMFEERVTPWRQEGEAFRASPACYMARKRTLISMFQMIPEHEYNADPELDEPFDNFTAVLRNGFANWYPKIKVDSFHRIFQEK